MTSTYLIINGARTINGTRLCRKLLASGEKVFCLDEPEAIYEVQDCLTNENFTYLSNSKNTITEIFHKIDFIIVIDN